jgi:2-polyprenyl-3-methyl-5-hydroxy-6-metoxy-1,4-benzoquinol methylase
MERIYPTKKHIEKSLEQIRLKNHIERYQIIKRYCYGNVIDIACGVGYGSHLLSNNPDINFVTGVDCNQESIDFANQEYKNDKTNFELGDIKNYNCSFFDTLVSLETFEHIEDLKMYNNMIERINPNIVILSFPNKKSTHFNPYHKNDLTTQQVLKTITKYVIVKELYQHDISILVMIKAPRNMPSHIFDTKL